MPSHTAYELVLAAFCANLPFGAYRATVRRMNWRWFLAIHLPIPAIFLLRTAAGYSYWFIPWLFLAAVSGQLLGSRLFAVWRGRRASGEPAPYDLEPLEAEEGPATLAPPSEQVELALQGAHDLLGRPDEEPLGDLR